MSENKIKMTTPLVEMDGDETVTSLRGFKNGVL